MTTYVLGAGASRSAGYPLAKTMGSELLQWMKLTVHLPDSYAARYPETARFLEQSFGPVENIEDLVTAIQKRIDEYENGTREQRAQRVVLGNEYGVLKNAVRAWFSEIQWGVALASCAYRDFARNVIAPGDRVITFNYDVSLERELTLAEKFQVGDGYGFPIENLPVKSATKVFKLHGSTSWLAPLFGGMTSGFAAFQPGQTLGRPAIAKNELSFLGYGDAIDPAFAKGGAALPVMIFPEQSKRFYFAPNTGIEYVDFWEALWQQAKAALQSASRLVICGYSLNTIDGKACKLLLETPKKNIEVIVASGESTDDIVKTYRNEGYAKARRADEVLFEKWIATVLNGALQNR